MRYASQLEQAGRRKRLTRQFEALDGFRAEYRRNISNGGIFIATNDTFDTRELVDVVLQLEWCSDQIMLEGEVVRAVAAVMGDAGAASGVAVQFVGLSPELRERLEQRAELPVGPARSDEHRRSDRHDTRVSGMIEAEGAGHSGRTENLSRSGVLMAIDGAPPEPGTSVRVRLEHPVSGESRELRGSVVRSEAGARGRAEVAVQFEESGVESADFIESVQAADHARRLGVIGGPIGSLGLANLLQMFSSCADRGMLVLLRDEKRGTIGFESGALVHARVGKVTGVKAVARMFGWTEGFFEFHETLEEAPTEASPCPIYGVVMEAMTQVDELARLDVRDFPRAAALELDLEVMLDADVELEKTDQAVLSRISAGVISVAGMLDGMEAFDAEIYAALIRLRDHGLLTIIR